MGAAAGDVPLWRAAEDTPFLQEKGRQIPTEEPVWAVGVYDGAAYAGMGSGLYAVRGNKQLEPVAAVSGTPVERLVAAGDALYAITTDALWRLSGGTWNEMAKGDFVDVCTLAGRTVVAGPRALYLRSETGLAPMVEDAPLEIQGIESYAETLYCLGLDRLFTFDWRDWDHENVVEFGALPSKDLRAMLALGSRLLVGTHQGIGVLRGTAATQILGADGLPYDETTALAKGFGRDYWVGTTRGAIRAVDGAFHLFTAARWLPDNHVNAIACGRTTAYIATNEGLGIIEYEPYTLLKKAAYYEWHLDAWNQKRMAFTHKLEWDAPAKTWMREVSDNDVGWSTHYWASQAFKYAVTGDETAKQNAIDGFNAMKWSEEITPLDGFPARSIWAVGETGHKAKGGSGGYAAEWHPTQDGKWEWKGDTSSDEIDAQVYYTSIFYELVADEEMKKQAREHIARIASHIIDNGWVLRDLDGKPTVWGRWDREYFTGKGRLARGLNGLEALNYMRTAYAITGNETFNNAYQQLLEWDYTEQVIWQKHETPKMLIFHSDDRLAFYNYYTVLQYEEDPHLRSIYRRSLERSYEIERIEHSPWFNFIYGARTGNDCEVAEAAEHLRAWPLDLVGHPYDFEARRDIHPPRGYLPYCDVEKPISPRERGGARWTSSGGRLQKGGGYVLDPAGWLDAYWMGRYYGFILPPDTDDPALTTLGQQEPPEGAAPYDGPPMPDVLHD